MSEILRISDVIPADGRATIFICRRGFWGSLALARRGFRGSLALATRDSRIMIISSSSSRISAEGGFCNDGRDDVLSGLDVPVMVVIGVGERLLKSIQDLTDCERIFAEPAQMKNGKMLMEFVKDFAPKLAKPFIGMQHGASFGWRPLSESLPTIPTIGNQVAVFFKLSLASGEHSELQPVVFSSLSTNFQIPFKGREEVMRSVAHRIDNYFEAVQSGSASREDMLFIAFEGAAGVGKTRCLLEIVDQTLRYLPVQSGLRHLYTSGAVQRTYITFNGTALGGRSSHEIPEFLLNMAENIGAERVGRMFMQACIVSESLYGRAFVDLPKDVQLEILAENVKFSMKKVADHIRKSYRLAPDQLVVLFVLVDEPQLLAMRVGAKGSTLLKGMFSMMGEFMTCETPPFRECNFILIPAVAGIVVPVVGHFGITDWSKFVLRLDTLDVDSAMEALRDAVNSNEFYAYSRQVKLLLEDCSCLPRLLKFIHNAWRRAKHSEMTEFVTYLRTNVFADVQVWVDTILSGDRCAVTHMVRLCLTGDKVSHHSELEMTECLKGYVDWREKDGGYVYTAPPLLLHALACRLKVHTNLVLLRPQPPKGDVLERAFLDGLHARLCLNEGADCTLGQLLPGAHGYLSLLEIVLKIGKNIKFVDEKFQFYITSQKRFRYKEDGILETECEIIKLPRANLLSKVRDCGCIVDGRLFVEGTGGTMYELWFQLKGQEDPLSLNEVDKLARAVLDARFGIPGRRRIYILVSRGGFSFSDLDERWACLDVLLLDSVGLEKCIPGFLRRCL